MNKMSEIYSDDWLERGALTLPSGEKMSFWWHNLNAAPQEVALFLHGIKGNHRGLAALAQEYINSHPNAAVIIPDLPGFGDSQAFVDLSKPLEQYIKLIDHIYDSWPSKKRVLIGHSFGAFLAYMYMSMSKPNRVQRAYLFAAQVTPKGLSGMLLNLYQRFGRALPSPLRPVYFYNRPLNRLESVTFTKSHDPEVRKVIFAERRKELNDRHPATLIATYGLVSSIDLRDLKPINNTQLVFIHGIKDSISVLSAASDLAKINKAEFVTVNSTGHFLVNETLNECAKVFAGDKA